MVPGVVESPVLAPIPPRRHPTSTQFIRRQGDSVMWPAARAMTLEMPATDVGPVIFVLPPLPNSPSRPSPQAHTFPSIQGQTMTGTAGDGNDLSQSD